MCKSMGPSEHGPKVGLREFGGHLPYAAELIRRPLHSQPAPGQGCALGLSPKRPKELDLEMAKLTEDLRMVWVPAIISN